MADLDGLVALVTGSTRGIGHGIARRLAAEGAHVIVHGRRTVDAERVAAEIPGKTIGIGADMADASQVATLIEAAVHEGGGLDVLVNNAGVALDGFVTRITDEHWNTVLATNLSGPFFAIRSAVPIMKRQGSGAIINIVSDAGGRGSAGQAAYSASKAGLIGLTFALAKELGAFGIRVNAISPTADTDMVKQAPPARIADAVSRSPLGRLADFDEVAEAALFLGSSRSRSTTGQILHVDGGFHLA